MGEKGVVKIGNNDDIPILRKAGDTAGRMNTGVRAYTLSLSASADKKKDRSNKSNRVNAILFLYLVASSWIIYFCSASWIIE
jgi:hypothetical protein